MLKCEFYYNNGSDYTLIDVPDIISLEIAPESIKGFSFWQVEGGTARLECAMFPELAEILDEQISSGYGYYDCEFRIYEGDTVREYLFLGYLKRGNYEYADDEPLITTYSNVTLTLENPLKVIVNNLDGLIALVNVGQSYNVLSHIQTLIEDNVLTYLNATVFKTPVVYASLFNQSIVTPAIVLALTIFDESNFPLTPTSQSWTGVMLTGTQRNIKQISYEHNADGDFLLYYRNVTKQGKLTRHGRTVYFAYTAIKKQRYQIAGSSLVPYPDNDNADILIDINTWPETQLPPENIWFAAYDLINIHTPLDNPLSSGVYELSGDNRRIEIYIDPEEHMDTPITVKYSGQSGYDAVTYPKRVNTVESLLKGLIRCNLASLTCKYNTIILGNKVADTLAPILATNPILAYPSVRSNPFTNDTITANDLPFGMPEENPANGVTVAQSMATAINTYFKRIVAMQLPHQITFEIDLNDLTGEHTYTLEVGKTYAFADFYVYITDIDTDYIYRTAKIKGLGKVYGN